MGWLHFYLSMSSVYMYTGHFVFISHTLLLIMFFFQKGYARHVNDQDGNGHMPIHISSLTANPHCMEVSLSGSVCLSVFNQATLYTTTTVYGVLVH